MERKCFWTYIFIGSVALVTLIMIGDGRLRGESVDMELASGEASRSFSFQLEIEGQYAFYDECRGLGSRNDVEEAVVQTPNGVTVRQKTPGALEWYNITLKRTGPTEPGGMPVWSWRKAMEDGDLRGAVKDGVITVWRIDPSPVEPVARWEFRNGWLAALSFEGSIEEMTIVHDGLKRTDLLDRGPNPRPNP